MAERFRDEILGELIRSLFFAFYTLSEVISSCLQYIIQNKKYQCSTVRLLSETLHESKFKPLVERKNSASHQHVQKETTYALSTINKIIHQDLSKDTRKKSNVNYLTDRHKKTRNSNAVSYMRSTWHKTNPTLRSLSIKRSLMSMKQMYRLEFTMYQAEKPNRIIGRTSKESA